MGKKTETLPKGTRFTRQRRESSTLARVLGAGENQGKENPDEQPPSSSEDQEDNEQSDDSEIDDYEEQSLEVLFIPDDAVECVAVR